MKENNFINKGLSSEEVIKLQKEGKNNVKDSIKGKSHLAIIFESFFTFFNVVLYLLAFVFFLFQLFYPNGLKYIPITKYGFLTTILFNALCSIISQEASKRKLQKMKLVTASKTLVIRDSKNLEINSTNIVLGDLIVLKPGDQVPCDVKLLDGDIYVDESMLTGESKAISKNVDDTLFGGTFVTSGYGKCLAIKVGKQTYSSTLEDKIKNIKKKKSKILIDIQRIIKVLLFLLIPIALIVALKMFYVGTTFYGEDGVHRVFTPEVITKPAATIVGMIPIGMILLASITLSESIIKLSKENTLVQELYAIENLSRVDTLCLDKTGTLTTQKFSVVDVIKYQNENLEVVMPSYFAAFNVQNETGKALKEKFRGDASLSVKSKQDFNSSNKYSSVEFSNGDVYALGAPEIIFKDSNIKESLISLSNKGFRLVGLTKNNEEVALFVLKDELREGITSTLKFFADLNVKIKIISGDNVDTVKQISKEAGVLNYENYISMENVSIDEIKNICDKYTIFGRSTPEQKQMIIKELESKGNVVGYVGDGVNDTISLRQADCSIALKSGTDSTKAVSDVVLLDDDFSHLPDVFKEGRRVISNIQRSMLLFLTKSFFIGIFSLLSVFMTKGLPIEIESIYIYEFISIALCGVLLSLQNNKDQPIKGDIVINALTKSLFYGLFLVISGILPLLLNLVLDYENVNSLIVLFITIAGLFVLINVCRPFTKYTIVISVIGVLSSILLAMAFPDVFLNPGYLKTANNLSEQFNLIFSDFFNFTLYENFKLQGWISLAIFTLVGYLIFRISYIGYIKLLNKITLIKKQWNM